MESRLARHRSTDWPRIWSDLMHMPDEFLQPFAGQEIRVDEYRADGHVVVRAEVPGIDPKKDIDLRFENGRLHLHIERRRETKVSEKNYLREEMRYGEFERVLTLPAGCTDKDVKATYREGVLEIHIPVDTAQSKQIPIAI